MKRLSVYLILSAILTSLLSGCGQESQAETERKFKVEAESASAYCVSKEDCYLCGNGGGFMYAEYYGQNNVGIISLNTFEVMPIEINRYDRDGQLIEKNTGVAQIRSFKNGENGFITSLILDADRGIANVGISPHDDINLNLENTAHYLCEDCLTELASDLHDKVYGVGLINFDKRKIRALQESTTGFGMSDYYIHCDFDKQYERIKVLVALCPLRYENKT